MRVGATTIAASMAANMLWKALEMRVGATIPCAVNKADLLWKALEMRVGATFNKVDFFHFFVVEGP